MPEIGQSLSHYSLVERIGKGGMEGSLSGEELMVSEKAVMFF